MPSFLDLPPEARLMVYDFVLEKPRAAGYTRSLDNLPFNSAYVDHLNVVQVCRVMHQEVTRLFYTNLNPVNIRMFRWPADHELREAGVHPPKKLGLVSGAQCAAQWAQVCSTMELEALDLVDVIVGGTRPYKEWMEDAYETDNACTWHRNLVDLDRYDFPLVEFCLDLTYYTVEKTWWPEDYPPTTKLKCDGNPGQYIDACETYLQEWIGELKKSKDEGNQGKLTREHFLKLVW